MYKYCYIYKPKLLGAVKSIELYFCNGCLSCQAYHSENITLLRSLFKTAMPHFTVVNFCLAVKSYFGGFNWPKVGLPHMKN